MNLKQKLLLVGFVLVSWCVAAQQNVRIAGKITESNYQQPLVGATVTVVETGYGSITDTAGRYLVLIPQGEFTLKISYQGYFTKKLLRQFKENEQLDIELDIIVNELDEVKVAANSTQQNVNNAQMGVTNLAIKNIKKIPTLLGEVDVIKSLFTLPGVASVGEGSSGFNVRGGGIDQNLILLDGAPIFNSSHLLGFFSVFNPDALRGIDFYRGGISAEYGGRTSSVLNVNLKEAAAEKLRVSGGIGLVSSRLMLETPLIKDKLGIYVAARASYIDYLFKMLPNENLKNTRANFYDITGKIDFKPSKKDKISLTVFQGYDNFRVAGDSLSNVEINATSSLFDWSSLTSTLAWSHFFGNRFSSKTSLINSFYDAAVTNSDANTAFELSSKIYFRNLKQDFTWLPSDKHEIRFGFSGNHYYVEPSTIKPMSETSQINYSQAPTERAIEAAGYTQYDITLSKFLSSSVGVRYVFFAQRGGVIYDYKPSEPRKVSTITGYQAYTSSEFPVHYSGFEPRIGVVMKISKNASLKLNANRMQQFLMLISNTTSALPTARWKLADSYTKPQIADQLSAGYFINSKNKKWESSIEVFYKKLQNVVDYKDGANLILEKYPETQLLQGNGYAYGTELYIKKNVGILTGWLSYTYSDTQIKIASDFVEETINNGQYFPPSYYKPHVLNILGNYAFSRTASFNFNFTYSTGRPITYPDYKFRVGNVTAPYFTQRNQGVIPDYIRLDVGLTFEAANKNKKNQDSWNFSVYNLLNRRNAYSVFFRTKDTARSLSPRVNIYRLSILGSMIPSITYNFKI